MEMQLNISLDGCGCGCPQVERNSNFPVLKKTQFNNHKCGSRFSHWRRQLKLSIITHQPALVFFFYQWFCSFVCEGECTVDLNQYVEDNILQG